MKTYRDVLTTLMLEMGGVVTDATEAAKRATEVANRVSKAVTVLSLLVSELEGEPEKAARRLASTPSKAIGRACAVLGYGTDSAADFDDGEPMDGRAAAKDERAVRRAEGSEGTDNVTPIGAKGRARTEETEPAPPAPPQPAPSRLPTTRRPAPAEQPKMNGTAATLTAPASDDRSNVHQHAQLRTLAEHGFDLTAKLAALKAGSIEDLTREQAKELIIEGRASSRSGQSLN